MKTLNPTIPLMQLYSICLPSKHPLGNNMRILCKFYHHKTRNNRFIVFSLSVVGKKFNCVKQLSMQMEWANNQRNNRTRNIQSI